MIQNKPSLFLELKKQSNFFLCTTKGDWKKNISIERRFSKGFQINKKRGRKSFFVFIFNFCTKCDTNFEHSSKGYNACVRYLNHTCGIQILADLENAVSWWRT